jgi:hypothetical protein
LADAFFANSGGEICQVPDSSAMNVSQREYDVTLRSAVWLGPEV